jgi:hypothetical protein
MADWTKPFTASYTWWRVPRASYGTYDPDVFPDPYFYSTGEESEQVDGIYKATLQTNANTETYETGNALCVGTLDLGTDLLRCRMQATFEDGTTEDVVLGTYNVSVPSYDLHSAYRECTAVLDGRLIELQQDMFDTPLVVPKNTNGWAYAARVVRQRNIPFAHGDAPVAQAVGTTMSFGMGVPTDDGGTVLSAYNTIMTQTQGARAASTDEYGRMQLRAPIDYDSAPEWTFDESNATFLGEAEDEFDTSKICNVVYAVYETSEGTVVGSAIDTESQWSVANYGRRKVAAYTFQTNATQAQADAKAAELLDGTRSIVRRVTIKHVWRGARTGDVVELNWPSMGITGNFAIRTQTIEVGSAGCLTTSELRRFERA